MTGKGMAIGRTEDGRVALWVGGESWLMSPDEAREVAGNIIEFADAVDLTRNANAGASDTPEARAGMDV